MNRKLASSARARIAGLAALLLCAALASLAQAQPAADEDLFVDEVTFEVVMYRVDLYLNDADEEVERLVEVSEGRPGQEIEYHVTARNDGNRIYREGELGTSLPIPDGAAYVPGSAGAPDHEVAVEFSTDGGESFSEQEPSDPGAVDAVQWWLQERFRPGDEATFSFRVTLR